jgi:hypothetical protein
MAAPLRLTVLITALTRLLLDVLTVGTPLGGHRVGGPALHAVGPGGAPATPRSPPSSQVALGARSPRRWKLDEPDPWIVPDPPMTSGTMVGLIC